MTELERIAELEKRLKERKRKALAKEYEKLGYLVKRMSGYDQRQNRWASSLFLLPAC
ncbi:hypothetical protein ABMB44_13265 [Levilactobacillus brevis]